MAEISSTATNFNSNDIIPYPSVNADIKSEARTLSPFLMVDIRKFRDESRVGG